MSDAVRAGGKNEVQNGQESCRREKFCKIFERDFCKISGLEEDAVKSKI